MTEAAAIALASAACTLIGALIHAAFSSHSHHEDAENTSAQLLLSAQEQLRATIEDEQILWQWNRQLMDHIFRGAPPPPPPAPAGLFEHERKQT